MPGTLCSGLSHTRDPDTWAVGWVLPPGLRLQLHTELLALPGLYTGPASSPSRRVWPRHLSCISGGQSKALMGTLSAQGHKEETTRVDTEPPAPYNTVLFLPGHWDSCSPQPSTRAPGTTQLGAWSSWHGHVTQGCNF